MGFVLVTGASGALGRELVTGLVRAGFEVRGTSRRVAPTVLPEGVSWARADLESGEGLQSALAGVDTIVHCATSALRRMRQVDVRGTQTLLLHARAARVRHFAFPSIVGIDRIAFSYYRAKLSAEHLVESGGLAWSILRATQFSSC